MFLLSLSPPPTQFKKAAIQLTLLKLNSCQQHVSPFMELLSAAKAFIFYRIGPAIGAAPN